MFLKLLTTVSAACLLSSALSAQAFNIDFNSLNVPDITNGGYPDIPGFWNGISPPNTPSPLFGLDGLSTNSTIFSDHAGPTQTAGTIPAAYEDIYRDLAYHQGQFQNISIDNLEVGNYTMVCYSWAQINKTDFEVFVNGVLQDSGSVDSTVGPFPATGYEQEVNLVTLSFTVQNAGELLELRTDGQNSSGHLNALQIFPSFGTSGCMQTTVNSLGGIPEILGIGSPATGSFSLRTGVLPGALPAMDPMNPGAIVCFVSNTAGASVPAFCSTNGALQTGTRCLSGSLVRVATGNPGEVGYTSGFGTYGIDVILADLDAQGINTAIGSTLYFQMVYRDTDAGCGSSVIRWTNSMEVTL